MQLEEFILEFGDKLSPDTIHALKELFDLKYSDELFKSVLDQVRTVLESGKPRPDMILTGPPGESKDKLMKIMKEIFESLDIPTKCVTRQSIVDKYMSDVSLLNKNRGKIVFIEEAWDIKDWV